ncbi:MAG: uracil-DNA glycosylase [Candidatus Bipolaricaulia bacterium]
MKSLFDSAHEPELSKLDFAGLVELMSGCQRCRLKESRSRVVPGEGPVPAELVFIGEGPGEVEDQTGRPFVGPAGQLLDRILESAGLKREEVYITNMVKCRPPLNRTPQRDEVEACWPYLEAQLRLLKPKIIVALGNVPAQFFLKTTKGISALRGQFFKWRGTEVFPMFHPSYLLRNPSKEKGSPKYLTWQDIQAVKERLDELHTSSSS